MIKSGKVIDRDNLNRSFISKVATGTQIVLGALRILGKVEAPTAPPGTNTTQVATTEFVEAVRVSLVNVDATKAPLASPALTGAPTAPTAAPSTSTTQLATTEFVMIEAAKSRTYAP